MNYTKLSIKRNTIRVSPEGTNWILLANCEKVVNKLLRKFHKKPGNKTDLAKSALTILKELARHYRS